MAEPVSPPRSTILLVDDEESMRRILERRLEMWGYAVVTATNGLEALQAAQTHRPDLILLDIMMPGMNGVEACRRLKGMPETQKVPVIFVTAKASQLTQEDVRAAGASGMLGKPYESAELLGMLQQMLGRPGGAGDT